MAYLPPYVETGRLQFVNASTWETIRKFDAALYALYRALKGFETRNESGRRYTIFG